MEFDMITFQDDLARRMLALPSFRRFFDGEAKARLGMSQQGRRRTRRKAVSDLMARGYAEVQARQVVRDAEDYASLLHAAKAS